MSALDLTLRVTAVAAETPAIRALTLVSDAGPLPEFAPGSHLVMDCGGALNSYSLTGEGCRPVAYTLSVLRRPEGRGGSRWVHALRPGDEVRCSRPRSAFPPVVAARHHLYVAGGIGITPILSHLAAARRWGRTASVVYALGPGAPVPHARSLAMLAPGADIVRGRAAACEALARCLSVQPMGTHLYVCGPPGLIGETLGTARRLGWPQERCHIERFAAPLDDPGEPFVARLMRSGRDVAVPAGVSLLDALEAAGVTWPSLCRSGVCGECRIDDAHGAIEHRDLFLSEDERAGNDCLMPCVSRARGTLRLEL